MIAMVRAGWGRSAPAFTTMFVPGGNARDDLVVPFTEGRLLASLIPSARFVPLEGRNHILLADEPAWPLFLRELQVFLAASQSP